MIKTILILLLSTQVCLASTEGVWTGADYTADKKILIAKSHSVIVSADVETNKVDVVEEQEPETKSCVEYNGGECEPSEYFRVTKETIAYTD